MDYVELKKAIKVLEGVGVPREWTSIYNHGLGTVDHVIFCMEERERVNRMIGVGDKSG